MFESHTTKEGDSMLICSMEDSHLINTIKLILRHIKTASSVLCGQQSENHLIAVFSPSYSAAAQKERAEESIRFYHRKIQPYIMEAALRGLDISALMQDAYKRSQMIPVQQQYLLESPDDDDDDEWYFAETHPEF